MNLPGFASWGQGSQGKGGWDWAGWVWLVEEGYGSWCTRGGNPWSSISSGARALGACLLALLALASCACVALPCPCRRPPWLSCPVCPPGHVPVFLSSSCLPRILDEAFVRLPLPAGRPAGSFMRERGLLWLRVLPRRGAAGRKRLVHATPLTVALPRRVSNERGKAARSG